MKRVNRLYIVGMLPLAGCASSPVSLTHDGQITVESISSAAGHVWWADVQASRGRTLVAGEFIRHRKWPAELVGHMDIEVLAPDGTKVTVDDVVLQPLPSVGGDTRRLAFSVVLAQRPLPGSTVRVIHHSGTCVDETGLGNL